MISNIKKRTSVRTYDGKPLSKEDRRRIEDSIISATGFFNTKLRIELVELNGGGNTSGEGVKLGTYGVIKGCPAYLVASLRKEENSFLELGYVLEKVILDATKNNLGTCWLAGTFDRKAFGEAVKLEADEFIGAASPIGYGVGKQRTLERLMRGMVGSNGRKPWETLFFENTYGDGLPTEKAGEYKDVLEMVRLGPSASNKQPWRIVKKGNEFHFYLEHTKNYPDSAQRMDMGIAMCHFELAAKELGLNGGFHIEKPAIQIPENVDYIITWK